MSFDLLHFQPGRGKYDAIGINGAPAVHLYGTTIDAMATITTSGYFDDLLEETRVYLEVGDLILARGTDGTSFIQITALTPAITTTIDVDIPANTITTAMIQNLAVTNGKLAADAVTTDKILAGTILGADIAAGTVTGSNIAATTVTAANIAPAAINRSKVFFADWTTTLGGSATETFTITGALTTSIVFTTILQVGATPRTIVRAGITSSDTLTIEFSGDPSTDHIVAILVLNVA